MGAQESELLPGESTSYRPPVLTSISGPGAKDAKTDGCEIVVLEGAQLGPRTELALESAGGPSEICTGALQDVPRVASSQTTGVASGIVLAPPMPLPTVFYWPLWAQSAQPVSTASSLAARLGVNATYLFPARDCYVSGASTRMTCHTAPGVGNELVWYVEIDGQGSNVLRALTSYHPPVIASYEGAGADLALTQGGQRVFIEGKHFGPLGTAVQKAVYSTAELSRDEFMGVGRRLSN